MIVQTKPEPYCPECGGKMKLRKPLAKSSWEPFWGCIRYPNCKGTRDILPNGKPEMDVFDY
ncbi:MAG: topoisomerase DNA-binding C4 zinc finger domain-containing protein [Planctomycetota bacterium]|jgi:ssDNA-binding Zn-finger/Zn-ribbon topoisomerase 1